MYDKGQRAKEIVSGFSVIELLISLVIMTILFSVGIVNYRSVSRDKALDGFTAQVVSDLRRAQQYAQASFRPCLGTFENISFFVPASHDSYTITANCSSSSIAVKSVVVNSNFEIVSNGTVVFLPLAGGVEDARIITLVSLVAGETQQISINESGDIIY